MSTRPVRTHVGLQMFLDRLALRSTLGSAEQEAVLALPTESRQFGTNQDIVALGQRTTHACLIAAGLAGRFEQTSDGDRQITALYIPGDMGDLPSTVLPRAASGLVALTDVQVLHVPHDALVQAADRHRLLALAFWRDCCIDAGIMAQWMLNVGRRDARSRLAHLFCELSCRHGTRERTASLGFDVGMSQAHLADALGLTPVHVNRTLSVLRQQGVLTLKGRRLTIHDWGALKDIADFNAAYLHLERQPIDG